MLKRAEETLLLRIIPKLFKVFIAVGILLIIISLSGITDLLSYGIMIAVFSILAWFVVR